MTVRSFSWLPACLLLSVAFGCAETRQFNIVAKPDDASILVDGVDHGKGSASVPITFASADDVHEVTATRLGLKDQTLRVTRDQDEDTLLLDLKPYVRRVHFTVGPTTAIVSVNGKPLSADPVGDISADLQFSTDAKNNWTTYDVTAERPGFQKAEITVAWPDKTTEYALNLDSLHKDVTISTNPPGVNVSVDGVSIGPSPATEKAAAFPFDINANQWLPHSVELTKAGYDPVAKTISWDDGKTDYSFDMAPKTKNVRVITDPPSSTVTIDGKELARDSDGNSVASLTFPPIDDKGTLKTYTAAVSKKTSDSEWFTKELPIGWDDGQSDYPIVLKEIKTRPVNELTVSFERDADGIWQAVPRVQVTIARKDVTEENPSTSPPVQVYQAQTGQTINTVIMSPDGSQLLFTVLSGTDADDFVSQILAVRPDGTGGTEQLTDGKALDIMPSYTPDGTQIVFSSNRAGKKLNVWEKSSVGAPGIAQLTMENEEDLWPSIDADPHPRLFYESLLDDRDDPRLYMVRIGTTIRTELTDLAISQPRISPKGDQIAFTVANTKTGKHDIYLMSDQGGPATNLTNMPDADNTDPVWSRDGSHLAFVSDRGVDVDRRNNKDIWIIDLSHPERPIQVTTNGSVDDSPAWDSTGANIYFRSNRGGAWGIWKTGVR